MLSAKDSTSECRSDITRECLRRITAVHDGTSIRMDYGQMAQVLSSCTKDKTRTVVSFGRWIVLLSLDDC